jgi:hypothetical protein
VKANGPMNGCSGISVDQAIARTIGGATSLSSLQVGLSTLNSYTDGNPGQHSRSISWSDPATPLYKIISPQAVFDRLVGPTGAPPTAASNAVAAPDPSAARRRALQQSALDYIRDSTASLQTCVSSSDRARLDAFLTSVRDLEQRVAAPAMQVGAPASCNASDMHGGGHDATDLPIILLGSGGGVLKQNVYQRWPATTPPQVADLHLMLMQKVYGCPDRSFGQAADAEIPIGLSQPTEILA